MGVCTRGCVAASSAALSSHGAPPCFRVTPDLTWRLALQHRSRKAVLAASSVTAPLARLPVVQPALVRPWEYLGCFNASLRELCPRTGKRQLRETTLPPKCTDPHFTWPAMIRPILTVRSPEHVCVYSPPRPSLLSRFALPPVVCSLMRGGSDQNIWFGRGPLRRCPALLCDARVTCCETRSVPSTEAVQAVNNSGASLEAPAWVRLLCVALVATHAFES